MSRLRLQNHPDQPWLSHVNASVLKVKLAMAIIGISSIHLLRTFIEAGTLGTPNARFTEAGVMWQTIIHALFIASALGIALVDRLSAFPREAPLNNASACRMQRVPLRRGRHAAHAEA